MSEGRQTAFLRKLEDAAGVTCLDVHADADHHRSVLTLAGDDAEVEGAARRLTEAAVAGLDLTGHSGAHPRRGIVDVVPFVHVEPGPDGRLVDAPIGPAAAARDRFAAWAADALALPCFLYGPVGDDPGATLPQLRREAWVSRSPDTGPAHPHPTAGAACVGARPVLVAYNLWLAQPDVALARRVAAEVRAPGLRTLGLAVGDRVQVSCNLIEPWRVGPGAAFDAVADRVAVAGAELVGLLPLAVLEAEPASRWEALGIGPDRTIEARLEEAGLDGGRSARTGR